MKLPRLNSPNLWRDSITTGLAILAVFETALAISAISLDCVWGDYNWVIKLLLVLGLFFLIVAIVFLAKYYKAKRGVSLKIRGIKVNIRQGDIFRVQDGKLLRLMSFLILLLMI